MATSADRARGIVALIALIQDHLRDVSENMFERDIHMRDATGLRLIAIGEAAKDIGTSHRLLFPDIAWDRIVAMRNFIAHNYDGISASIIWATVKDDLPRLAAACSAMMDRSSKE